VESQDVVRVVAAILALLCLGAVLMRRRTKKRKAVDEDF
jgi:hypothetical protein